MRLCEHVKIPMHYAKYIWDIRCPKRMSLFVAAVVIVFLRLSASAFNQGLWELNMNIRNQTDAIDNAAWQMQRAAEESARLREATEFSALMAFQAEQQRKKEAAAEAAAAEAARQKEYEAARAAEGFCTDRCGQYGCRRV